MSLSDKFNSMFEGQHYNTKVRGIDENIGSRKIRLGVKECLNMAEKMLDKNNTAPNPSNPTSTALLKEASDHLNSAIVKLKEVKECKGGK